MKPFVIGINGPPEIGKSWLATHIAEILPFNCRIMSHTDYIRMETMDADNWSGSYADYKKYVFPNGESGRDRMIERGNMRRREDAHYWDRKLTEDRRFTDPSSPIIIVDTLGFRTEQQWLEEAAEGFMTIVMAPTCYSIGDNFKGDNRVCLRPVNGFRTYDSNSALRIFKERLSNATGYESIDTEKRRIWFSVVMGRSMVE